VTAEDDATSRALARRQADLRREIDRLTLRSKREMEDQRRKARWELDRQVDDARRRAEQASRDPRRPPAAAAGGSGSGAGASAGPDWSRADEIAGIVAIPVVALAALPLAVGHVAALLTSGEWPRYRLADAPGIVGRVVAHPGDPGAAWDEVNTGGAVPGPVAWWVTFLLVAALLGALAYLVYALDRALRAGRGGNGWATAADRKPLVVRRNDPHRLVLGTVGNDAIGLRDTHSLLVIGPAAAGKTSGVTIPALLEWPGPAVVVSTKGHLVDQTIGWRSHQGDVHVFDPAATTSYPRSGWSLLADCASWPGAIRTARDLTVAAKASVGSRVDAGDLDGIANDALWSSSMAMTLAPYLFAAVASGRSISTAIRWIAREEQDEVLEVLRPIGGAAARAHETNFVRDDPDRSYFLHLMHRILSVYDDPVVAASMDRHEIVPDELLDGGHHTLYLTAPEHDQARFRPLSAAILRQVLATAYDRSAALAGPLDPPLLLLLGQVVGIAPIDDLAAVASTGAARGVQVVSVFKDMQQIDGHYGRKARLLVNNHPAKLVFPRGPDVEDDLDEPTLVPPALEAELRDGEAALVYGNRRPIRLTLRPWYKVKELRRRRETPQDVWDPADHGGGTVHPHVPREQLGAWLRRGSERRGDLPDDPGFPSNTQSPEFTSIFGSVDEDDTAPINVTPLSDARNPFRRL
jgi:type IV secretion system protein VirD4